MAWAACALVIAGLNWLLQHSASVRGWDVSPRWGVEAAGRGDGVRGVGVATRGHGLAAFLVVFLALALLVIFFGMTDLLTSLLRGPALRTRCRRSLVGRHVVGRVARAAPTGAVEHLSPWRP